MRTVGKNMTHCCHVWACILFLIDRKGGQQGYDRFQTVDAHRCL